MNIQYVIEYTVPFSQHTFVRTQISLRSILRLVLLERRRDPLMIHLDIIKYVMNPLLNWDDCEVVNIVHSANCSLGLAPLINRKKHYSQIDIQSCKIHMIFDEEKYTNSKAVSTLYSTYELTWKVNDQLHRSHSTLPSLIWTTKSSRCDCWHQFGKTHRNERDEYGRVLPAIIWNDGTKFWRQNGKDPQFRS